MGAHVKPPVLFDDLESPICDLARKAMATSIICKNLIDTMRSAAKCRGGPNIENFMAMAQREIGLLSAYVDDLDSESDRVRDIYYAACDAERATS